MALNCSQGFKGQTIFFTTIRWENKKIIYVATISIIGVIITLPLTTYLHFGLGVSTCVPLAVSFNNQQSLLLLNYYLLHRSTIKSTVCVELAIATTVLCSVSSAFGDSSALKLVSVDELQVQITNINWCSVRG